MFRKDKKPKEESEPIDEMAFQELGIDWTLRAAFMRDKPLTYEEYVNSYDNGQGAALYRRTPHYNEYLMLYEKYKRKGGVDPDFYIANMG